MKITMKEIYSFLLILALLCQNRFFHMINASMGLTLCLLTIILLLFIFAITDKYNRKCKYFYNYIILLSVVVIIPQTLYAFIQGETLEGYIDVMRGIINILLVFPILKLFIRKKGMKDFLDIVTFLTCISLGMIIINSFFLNNFKLQVFPFDYFKIPVIGRNSRLRIYLISDFTAFVAIYSFCRLLKKDTRNFSYILSFAVCLVASIYVEQSRMQYIAIIVSCIITYTRILKKNRLFFYIIGGVFVMIGMSENWFMPIFETFSISNKFLGISTLTRLNEYIYALKLIAHNPILGSGMVSNYLFDVSNNGFYYKFNHTDIGLLGFISYIGIPGAFIMFILPYIRLVKVVASFESNEQNNFEFCFLLGIVIFITITALTTLIVDNARIFAWPFILAVFEYVRLKRANLI